VGSQPTPSQTVGPFFGFALPYGGDHEVVPPGTPGAVRVEGQVIDGGGEPVPDALVEVWQAGPDGAYAAPNGGNGFHGFGRCRTDAEGAFRFVTVKPGPTPAPDGRAQAPHLNVTVFARGLLRHLVTRMYFPDEPAANETDPVLTLVADQAARATLVAHDEAGILRFDIHLQGDRETVFFAL
jgi:protocatechuate 3,4-dioxygenase alpha subunit